MASVPQKYIQEISQFFNDPATIISFDTKKNEFIVNMNSINCGGNHIFSICLLVI